MQQNWKLEIEQICRGLDACLNDDDVSIRLLSIYVSLKYGALDLRFDVGSIRNEEARRELVQHLHAEEIEVDLQVELGQVLPRVVLNIQVEMVIVL